MKYEQLPLFQLEPEEKKGPVECLGMTFENDSLRREHFLAILREKLKDPDFRKIEGFPIGSDEDILALSDPPYYTACPNPFIEEFVKHYGKPYDPEESYSREPFAVDVSEGKTDSLYKAHSYHTKVPHLAIVPSILHYTEPGDIVLDGFCGSGMTGVAAQWCGNAPPVYRKELESDWQKEGHVKPKWGVRRCIINDLSPAATFIAANYTIPFDIEAFAKAGKQLLNEVEKEIGWMYETLHTDGKTKGRIEYTVWSEVFTCPNCSEEINFLEKALDEESKRVKESFPCPKCNSNLTKDNLERVFESSTDPILESPWKRVKFRPSIIFYTVNDKRYEKAPTEQDLKLLEQIACQKFHSNIPYNQFPIDKMYHGSRIAPKGFTNVHHLFFPRISHALALLWEKANAYNDNRIRHMLLFFVEQAIWTASKFNRYRPTGYSQVNQYLTGVYYIPSQHSECSPWYILKGKLERLMSVFKNFQPALETTFINTGSLTFIGVPNKSVDYIFTDPPFGENIYYADLNFLVEAWHYVFTDAKPEAIIDMSKGKEIFDYKQLMQYCFCEYYRVLKPGRWMTMVFHNSRNAVWSAIQEALVGAGFVVADVRTMDKQQGSFRQVTSTAVKQDLVISAYKPNSGLEERFKLEAGTEEGVWDFIRAHLKQLPVFVSKNDKTEIIAERQNYLLFDRMVAFHVQRGVTVPISSSDFYQGLNQRFPERDGMYFLPEQAAEYDKKRITVKEMIQLQLFVTDEASAIQWLKQHLVQKTQTFQELHPQFLKEIGGWLKHEKSLELSDLLEQNFLRYDGKGDVPSQIHSYLSSNFRDMRNLPKDSPELRTKAKDRWYVPDPNKAGDLEKLRERTLLREFQEYKDSKQKRIKIFRLEAVRAGFRKAWQEKDYDTIIDVAGKIPENVLQEDPKLLMWFDQALTRSGGDK